MIFAAGFGTRMRPLTNDRPKPMVHVANQPMIDYAIDHARTAGAEKIVSNTHYLADVIEPHLQKSGIQFVREEPNILDTGGGLRNAIPLLGSGPVWTLNPDTIWRGPNPLAFANAHWDADKMDALLVCIPPEQALGTDNNGDFTLGTSGALNRGIGHIYGGAQIINTETLSVMDTDVFSLNVVWDRLIADNRCFGCIYPGTWCDIGHPDGLHTAEKLLRETAGD